VVVLTYCFPAPAVGLEPTTVRDEFAVNRLRPNVTCYVLGPAVESPQISVDCAVPTCRDALRRDENAARHQRQR
jgi:hypothetical protein